MFIKRITSIAAALIISAGTLTAMTASASGGWSGVRDTSGMYNVSPENFSAAVIDSVFNYRNDVDFSKVTVINMINYYRNTGWGASQPGYTYNAGLSMPVVLDIPSEMSY